MVAYMDTDHSGTFTRNDFKDLWYLVKVCWVRISISVRSVEMNGRSHDCSVIWKLTSDKIVQYAFSSHASDGSMKPANLHTALRDAGISITRNLTSLLVLRYRIDGAIEFDDFIGCNAKLHCLFGGFRVWIG